MPPRPERAARTAHETEPAFALAAWLALFLVVARAGVLLALEHAHHGDLALAWMRVSQAVLPLVVGAAGLALATALAAWGAALVPGRVLAWGAPFVFAALYFVFLWGRLDADASRRIGHDTAQGRAALGVAALAGLVLSAFYFLRRLRALHGLLAASWTRALVPLALLALVLLGLRLAFGALEPRMEVRRVERELAGMTWEVLRAHADGAPAPSVLCPSVEYRENGAARPALLLPPPARVRRVLSESDASLWLLGGAGLDQSVHEVAERYPGHALRLGLRIDGVRAFEATLPLVSSPAWVELGGGAGLAVRPGAQLELESALLDASGAVVEPADPLPAGFGGLVLERRTRVPRTRASRAAPNIVLVVLDTLRADRTSAYGYARDTTPHLAELARRGVLFEEAHSTASWTWPSTASILTGLLPEEHGVEDAASSFLSEGLDTLAEALQRAGYTTAAWSGSPLIVPDKRFDQGFEFFDASHEGNLRRSDIVMPGALEWLGTAREWRFFLYLHLMEPHAPFVPLAEGRQRFAAEVPRSFDPRKAVDYQWELLERGFSESGEARPERVVSPEEQRWISDLYDGCVWSGDHWLGRLLERLEELELADTTIVAVTSDHGEELFDHGLLAHAHTVHRELVRVPLVLAGPGIPAGQRVSVPVSCTALGPTLARLGGSEIEGLGSVAPRVHDLLQPGNGDTLLFSTLQGYWNGAGRQPLFGLREGTSVLHFAPRGAPYGTPPSDGEGQLRLYDLAHDPEERTDLAPAQPERARALRARLLALLEALESRRTETGGAVDPATLDVLRGLGYTGDEDRASEQGAEGE